MGKVLTQSFRAYVVISVLAAGFTALWTMGLINVTIPFVGYAWFAVAAIGAVIVVGMIADKEGVLVANADADQVDRFSEATITGRPFEGYIAALAIWAAVSFGWILGGMGAAGLAVVGYGWLAIAGYGAVVGVGIAVNHKDDLVDAVAPAKTATPANKD
jgi:hypothetical protein